MLLRAWSAGATTTGQAAAASPARPCFKHKVHARSSRSLQPKRDAQNSDGWLWDWCRAADCSSTLRDRLAKQVTPGSGLGSAVK
jgi:hypothetical protein